MTTLPATDPASVDVELNTKTNDLDSLGKDLDHAVKRLDTAEEAWDRIFDATAESLAGEYQDAGRKTAPSENAITSAARREHRTVYVEYRRAKRHLDAVEKKMQAARTIVSARQTQANGLRDEMKMGTWSR